MNNEQQHGVAAASAVVVICDDVLFFRSAAEAEGYMEPIDVENGEYRAVYDENGGQFRLEIVTTKEKLFFGLLSMTHESVRIDPDPTLPVEPEHLRARLIAYLDRTKQRGQYPPDASLAELVRWGAAKLGV